MAMSVTYMTIDGELVAEKRGGVVTTYVPDTQGSLVQCHNSTGTKVYEAWYWPYGEVRQTFALGPKSNSWGYIGLKGYLTDLANLLYVRARYYRPDLTRWQTVDPLWPRMSAYLYCGTRPNQLTDPSGRLVEILGGCLIGGAIGTIGSLIGGDSIGTAICKGIVDCAVGALITALLPEDPGLLGCAVGGVGGLVGAIGEYLCTPQNPCSKKIDILCGVGSAILSFILGCAGGASDLANTLINIIINLLGLDCNGIGKLSAS